jgi:hypothetical protein
VAQQFSGWLYLKGYPDRVLEQNADYVLDNQTEDILLWSKTGYRFVKRQSQSNPNVWVSLDDLRPAVATAASR